MLCGGSDVLFGSDVETPDSRRGNMIIWEGSACSDHSDGFEERGRVNIVQKLVSQKFIVYGSSHAVVQQNFLSVSSHINDT